MKLIATGIFGVLPQKKEGNQFIMVMANRFSKLSRVIPKTKTTARNIAAVVVEICHMLLGIAKTITVLVASSLSQIFLLH